MLSRIKNIFRKKGFESSEYWESRYREGGNSGTGSYNALADFKADIINQAVIDYKLESIIEFGCGDGNQLSLLKVPDYVGLDVSPTILQRCIEKFAADRSKSFFLYNSRCFIDRKNIFKMDAAMSIDVVFHLVEQEVYEAYLSHLFNCALKTVIIYGADLDIPQKTQHEVYRKFTSYIARKFPEWKLEKHVKNKYPSKNYEDEQGSLADFYFFTKTA